MAGKMRVKLQLQEVLVIKLEYVAVEIQAGR
jgi:hypothetical protein